MALRDGLAELDILMTGSLAGFTVASGAQLLLTGSVLGYSEASGGDIAVVGSVFGAASFSGTTAQFAGSIQAQSRSLALANLGSPAAYANLYIQAGSGLTDAASIFWVVLPEGFANSTYFISTATRGTANVNITTIAGSTNAGSFFAISHGAASTTFDWIAVGNR